MFPLSINIGVFLYLNVMTTELQQVAVLSICVVLIFARILRMKKKKLYAVQKILSNQMRQNKMVVKMDTRKSFFPARSPMHYFFFTRLHIHIL